MEYSAISQTNDISRMTKYPGKPLTIFNFDESSQENLEHTGDDFQFDFSDLEKIFMHKDVKNRKVAVISIIGAFRKGKSFLLDYFLRYLYANYKSVSSPTNPLNQNQKQNWIGNKNDPLRGFSWKGGAMRNTTGIIFWSDVFLYDSNNGEKIAILLMDTQGLFDHKSSPTDNSRIFSISTLISSIQILNLFNHIQEDHLQYLQFATEFAKYIRNSKESGKPFQSLLFLIRDWGAADDFPYGLNGGKDLLAQVLEVDKKQKPELRSLREYIFKSFDKISCFLMPHPGPIVASKKDYDGRWAQIDPEFMDYMKDLVETLLAPENIIIKKINHENLTASDLLSYIRHYGEIYKFKDLPQVQSIYEATVSNNMQILIAKAFLVYTEKVQKEQQFLETEKDIHYLHQIAEHAAFEIFNDARKMGGDKHEVTSREELNKQICKSFGIWNLSAIAQIQVNTEQRRLMEQLEVENRRNERGCCNAVRKSICVKTIGCLFGCCYKR